MANPYVLGGLALLTVVVVAAVASEADAKPGAPGAPPGGGGAPPLPGGGGYPGIPAGMPGGPPAGAPPGQGGAAPPGTLNIPGLGNVPIPAGFPMPAGFPGSTVPASSTTPEGGGGEQGAPPPGTTVDTPLGPMQIPSIPGFNTPQGQPAGGGGGGGTQPQQPDPGAPAPGTTVNTPLGPMQIPSVPGLNAPDDSNGGQPTPSTWPADHWHTIRAGDIASRIAQWFTGNFARAEELRSINNLTKQGSGNATYYTPWKVGQKLKLPLDWNTSKGPMPPATTAGLSIIGDIDRLARGRALNIAARAAVGRRY